MNISISWPKLLVAAFALLAVVVLAAGGLFYVHLQNLPVYEDGQEEPVDGIAVNTLRHGDLTYTSGPFEFSLEVIEQPFDIPLLRLIGTTSYGLDIYKPVGHDGSKYVFTRGEMMGDSVYRNGEAPQISLDNLNAGTMEYIESSGGSAVTKRTTDKTLIDNLVATLANGTSVPASQLGFRGIYHVRLFSDQLPGLAYFAYVIVDNDGRIYLAHRGMENQSWITADSLLSQWLQVSY